MHMRTQDACDVLIVGGGPAGSTCARALRGAGLDVVVMDKAQFPRDKVCAGWITPSVVTALDLDLEDYRHGRVLQPIQRFRTGQIDGAAVEVDYPAAVSYGIRRVEFDHYLLARSGARLRLGEALQLLERADAGWRVNGSLRAAMLVGAGGHFCPVARYLGAIPGGDIGVVRAQEVEFELSHAQLGECQVSADRPELYFCEDLKGYGWCFRKGDYLNIGLGREDSHHLSRHVEEFCESLIRRERIPRDIPRHFHGHAYLLYPHAPRPWLDAGVLLIGDAAGLASAQSGEGIRPAVESGLLAAETIFAAGGDYRRERLEPYAVQMVGRFGRRSRGVEARRPVPLVQGIKQLIARPLFDSRWFARHVILDRWFLHVA
jgi:menaquinone-9 beta-reductase